MKYLKDVNTNAVYAYESDGSQDEWIKPGLIEMTPEEVEAHFNPAPSLGDARKAKHAEINAAYSAEMSAILSKYPDAETLTWDKQESEARAYAEWQDSGGTEPSTPIIAAIAQGRQMSKDELVTRIIEKADAWIEASGIATGKRQALEDRINNAEAVDELNAIQW